MFIVGSQPWEKGLKNEIKIQLCNEQLEMVVASSPLPDIIGWIKFHYYHFYGTQQLSPNKL